MTRKISAVLDTDAYNEVDDQFALAHLLLSPEEVDLQAVYAAPFVNKLCPCPEKGMELSYQEIINILEYFSLESVPEVFFGSRRFMSVPDVPISSDAAEDLIFRARHFAQSGEILHVLAIGACTNVASAIMQAPDIIQAIKIIWLGGHAPYSPDVEEYNLTGDLHATRYLFDQAPLVQIPCWPVASHLQVTAAELELQIAGSSRLGRYLTNMIDVYHDSQPGWSKHIWDIAVSGYAVNPSWFRTEMCPSPIVNLDLTLGEPPNDRRQIEIATHIRRNLLFHDFYAKMRHAVKAGILT